MKSIRTMTESELSEEYRRVLAFWSDRNITTKQALQLDAMRRRLASIQKARRGK